MQTGRCRRRKDSSARDRRITCLAHVTTALALLSPRVDASAQPIRIGDSPACAGCQIIVEHVATLGAESDPDSPAASFVIARDSSGRFFVAPMSNRASIGIYARTGEYVDVIGRPGGGPGEFTYAQEVKVIRGDTVLVMDRAQLRYTILTSGLELVDVIRMAFPDDGAIAYGSRDIVAHASVESPERVGHALHHLVDGQPIRSFAATGNVLPGNAIERRRRLPGRTTAGSGQLMSTDTGSSSGTRQVPL